MSDTVSKIPKPQLRGLLNSQIKRSLVLAVGLCFTAAIAQKLLVNDPRKKAYAEFYKSYDINKEFERMRKRGVFDSC